MLSGFARESSGIHEHKFVESYRGRQLPSHLETAPRASGKRARRACSPVAPTASQRPRAPARLVAHAKNSQPTRMPRHRACSRADLRRLCRCTMGTVSARDTARAGGRHATSARFANATLSFASGRPRAACA